VRRVLAGTAIAVLALTALPAFADSDPDAEPAPEPAPLAECALPAGTERLTVDGVTGTIDTPSLVGEESTSRVFVLDLAGLPVGTTGAADVTMTWGVPANDYDLDVNGVTSENYQPFDDAVETAGTAARPHCSRITVTAIDFLAPVVVDTLSIDVKVRTVAPRA
jgi:hypothetical protein